MAKRKMFVIEEIDLGDGNIGHRQSSICFDQETGELCRPTTELSASGLAEWDRVMGILNAQGIASCVNGPALLDHCLAAQAGRAVRQRGKPN